MVSGDHSNGSKRSLYECLHARVKGDRIYCEKGYRFKVKGRQNGSLNIEQLARGEPLVMSVCQECVDFESMGDPIPAQERGWLQNTVNLAA